MRYYYVSDAYVSFLKQFDSKVPDNKHEKRPYIGIVFYVEDVKYYAPLSSPKSKHLKMKNGLDLMKIKGGALGVINFNNMIPVPDKALINFNIEDIKDSKYKSLLIDQIEEINHVQGSIVNKAKKLRELCLKDGLRDFEVRIKQRCCDFKLLEEKMNEY